jgi:hypothetical protein
MLADRQLDERVALVVVGERGRQVDRSHRVYRPDGDAAGLKASEALQLVLGGRELREDPSRTSHEQLAGLGDRHAPSRTLDERQAKLALEPLDLLGQRRLCDVFPHRRSREAAFLGERNDVTELADLHRCSL